ncbi:MAG: sensor histidine kinase, partial [Candidatus Limnocylindrales bacterium]
MPEIEPGTLARLLRQVQKMDVLGQLASGVAHESSNALTAIVGFGRLIETDPRLPEDMRHDAGLLTREADRTRRMIGDLLDLARQRPPERYPAAVAMLLRSALDLQVYALAAAHVTVSLVIPDDLPTVDVDRAQMQQVLLGLILNAIDAIAASGRPGRIVIGAEVARPSAGPDAAGERIRISVSDDGPGVPAGALDRIFSPFFTTKEPGKGTGLG